MGFFIFLIILCAEVGFAIWSFATKEFHKKEKLVVRIGCLILMLVLLACGVLEGMFRYGMLMGILVLQIVIGGVTFLRNRNKPQKIFKKGRTVFLTVGTVLAFGISLIPAILFPQYEKPPVTGSHEIETREYTWVDDSRVETYTTTGENRELTVKLWYPKEEGNYPLIVFSHGAFGVIDSNHSTFQELASNGYVVASIAHTYHAIFVENTDGDIRTVSLDFLKQLYEGNGTNDPEMEKVVYENSLEWMSIRTADENFVLDTILEKAKRKEEDPFSRIDTDKTGLFGHSMGGASAVELGRMRQDIDAVIDLEGTMFGEYTGFENGRETYDEEPYPVPILDVNSARVDAEAKSRPEVLYVNFYLGERAVDYHYEVIEGAGHLNFTDLPMVSPILAKFFGTGDVDAKECTTEINALILDFFNQYLKE